jgi:hypothetical protein
MQLELTRWNLAIADACVWLATAIRSMPRDEAEFDP